MPTELEREVYEILRAFPGVVQIKQIYVALKRKAPHLCDERFPSRWRRRIQGALQSLKRKNLAQPVIKKGFWIESSKMDTALLIPYRYLPPTKKPKIKEPPPSTPYALHDEIKEMLYEIGEIEGKHSDKEYRLNGERIDVVWKRIETGNPYAVFEVHIGGNFYEALIKLKYAWDKWNCRPFLITSGQFKDKALEWIKSSFHEIEKEIKIIDCQRVRELYEAVKRAKRIKDELELS